MDIRILVKAEILFNTLFLLPKGSLTQHCLPRAYGALWDESLSVVYSICICNWFFLLNSSIAILKFSTTQEVASYDRIFTVLLLSSLPWSFILPRSPRIDLLATRTSLAKAAMTIKQYSGFEMRARNFSPGMSHTVLLSEAETVANALDPGSKQW